jgi:hypothetical protein
LVHFSTGVDIKYDKVYQQETDLALRVSGPLSKTKTENLVQHKPVSLSFRFALDKITEYGYRSGIANGNYAAGACATRDDELVSFGSTEGVTSFFPDRVSIQALSFRLIFQKYRYLMQMIP